MTIYKGSNEINKLYLGSTQINKVYLGDKLILGTSEEDGGGGSGGDTTKYSYNTNIISANNGVELDGSTGLLTFNDSSSYFEITLPEHFLTQRGQLYLVFKQTEYPSSNPYLFKIGSNSGGTFTYSSRAYISSSDKFVRMQINGSSNSSIKGDEIYTTMWYGCSLDADSFNSKVSIGFNKGLNNVWTNEKTLSGYSLSTTDNILRIGSNNQNTIIDGVKSRIEYYGSSSSDNIVQFFVK